MSHQIPGALWRVALPRGTDQMPLGRCARIAALRACRVVVQFLRQHDRASLQRRVSREEGENAPCEGHPTRGHRVTNGNVHIIASIRARSVFHLPVCGHDLKQSKPDTGQSKCGGIAGKREPRRCRAERRGASAFERGGASTSPPERISSAVGVQFALEHHNAGLES